MPKVGQFRVGAMWLGGKEPDILPSGKLRYYDKRCRCRCILGSQVRGSIGKNSIWRVRPPFPWYSKKYRHTYQDHYKWYSTKGAPGTRIYLYQQAFAQAMSEVPSISPADVALYKQMEQDNMRKNMSKPGTYRAYSWANFYLMWRLPQLYALIPPP